MSSEPTINFIKNIDASEFLAALAQIENCQITKAENLTQKYTEDWRQKYRQTPLVMVQPQNTQAVQDVVRLCQKYQRKIVMQGGNTSLCGGSIASDDQQVLLNLAQLKQIRTYDELSKTAVVEAGCTLADIQAFAKSQGAFYPLSLPSEAHCTIGGNLSTNAGGVAVLRYGNSRQLCLGLEVVLANGELYQGLYQLHKNNMGYDLKHLFIGAEGTLGIITAATLQFFEAPSAQKVYLLACKNLTQMMAVFKFFKQEFSPLLTAFELMNDEALSCVQRYLESLEDFEDFEALENLDALENIKGFKNSQNILLKILKQVKKINQTQTQVVEKSINFNSSNWYALCEITEYPWVKAGDFFNKFNDFSEEFQGVFEDVTILQIENNIQNIILQTKTAQRYDDFIINNNNNNNEKSTLDMHYFWQIRHQIPAAQKFLGGNLKHDISVKLGDIAEFITQARQLVLEKYPEAEFVLFGHVGDGNIHFNVDISAYQKKLEENLEENLEKNIKNIGADISKIIHDLIEEFHGSIAAEHGIGRLKKDLLKQHTPPTHYQIMQALKKMLDEEGTLNPQSMF